MARPGGNVTGVASSNVELSGKWLELLKELYGPSLTDMYARTAAYVARIFGGVRPADLPVEQPTKFDLVINMRTARALGLTVPASLLARGAHVLE